MPEAVGPANPSDGYTDAEEAEALLDLGRRMLPHDVVVAGTAFAQAVVRGRLPMLHRVIDCHEAEQVSPIDIGVWKRRGGNWEFPRTDAPLIDVSMGVFGGIDHMTGSGTDDADGSITVQSSDQSAAAGAVDQAAASLRLVRPDAEVSLPRAHDDGVTLRVTTEGPRFGALRTAVNLIIDHLLADDVHVAYLHGRADEPWTPNGAALVGDIPSDVAGLIEDAADDPSGEAAFRVGVWYSARGRRAHALAWFKRATAVGPFELVWRVIDHYAVDEPDGNGNHLVNFVRRAWREEFPRLDAPRISVQQSVFLPIIVNDNAGYGHDTSIVVKCRDRGAATDALRRAAARFGRVRADGRTLDADEEPWADGEDVWSYTPNFVSDVEESEGHPMVWMDWKDVMAPRMARTMVHTLVDELRDAEVGRAIIASRAGD